MNFSKQRESRQGKYFALFINENKIIVKHKYICHINRTNNHTKNVMLPFIIKYSLH